MPTDYFDERSAERDDEEAAELGETAVVEPVAGDGAALERGSGTGRMTLPLAQRRVRRHSIDLSEMMVAAPR